MATTIAEPTVESIRSISQELGVEFYFAQFVDMYARPSAKLVPAACLDDLLPEHLATKVPQISLHRLIRFCVDEVDSRARSLDPQERRERWRSHRSSRALRGLRCLSPR